MIKNSALTIALLLTLFPTLGLFAQPTTAIYSKEDLARFMRYTRWSAASEEPVQVFRIDLTFHELHEVDSSISKFSNLVQLKIGPKPSLRIATYALSL